MHIKQLLKFMGFVVCLTSAYGQTANVVTFQQAFDAIKARPEFRHSSFGVEVYSLDSKKALFEWNGQSLFVPGSTTKLLTVGTALNYLGADYRFHTPVYRTGPLTSEGELKGDLVLVASGDPNLSGRLQKDGTLGMADEDHSYGGPDSKLIGDPLAALNNIASQIAALGVRKVSGRVLIDSSLFPEGAHELGTGATISPIVVNDNFIDVVISPGPVVGSPAKFTISPQVSFIRFIGEMVTAPKGSKLNLVRKTSTAPDGTLEVTTTGSIPVDYGNDIASFAVPNPSRFAAALLVQALENKGISVGNKDFSVLSSEDKNKISYKPENKIAEYVSAPLSEEIKIILKVSQNLHASDMPFILGAVVGHVTENTDQKGFDLEHDFLMHAGLDLSGASQNDGAGGSAFFTPDFVVHYLDYMSTQPNFAIFKNALPVLGRDGSLAHIEKDSPAAGLVFAKTGTYIALDLLNRGYTLAGKALAGYTTTASGERVAFALYVNHTPALDKDAVTAVGQTLGEIGADIHLLPIDQNIK